MIIESTGTPILYLGFTLLVIVLLAVDFFVLKAQGAHRVTVKEAAGLPGHDASVDLGWKGPEKYILKGEHV